MKSFEEKLTEQFTGFSVSAPEESSHMEHLYADYVELVAVFSAGAFVTSSDVLDRLFDEGKLKKEGKPPADFEIGSTAPEENDENEKYVQNIFRVLEGRSSLFGDNYPFTFSRDKIILKEDVTFKHKVYLTLLVSSNLPLFKMVKSELTSDFEVISYYSLKAFLPAHAIVKQFGKKSDYTGTAIEKIKSLARDLKVEVREHELANISERNYQERGLDLIGWIPFVDGCPNFPTILGQCACGREWASKHHDTTRYLNYLKFFRLDPYKAMFIPYSLVTIAGRFYRSDDIEKGTLVFERKRIVDFFDEEEKFNELSSKEIVDKCLAFREGLV